MIYTYLQRGVTAGLFAGIAYGMYMITVGNPLTEYVHDAGHSHDHGHAVSETTNAVVSVGSGILWAIFLGGVFAIAYYVFEPAVPGSEMIKPYVVAAAGFLSISAVPWLVLPPAAPGAEHAYTIDVRLTIYVGLVFVGLLTVSVMLVVYKRLRQTNQLLRIIAASAVGGSVGVAILLFSPTVATYPDLPTELVTVYQALAALSQAAIWGLIATVFVALSRRDGQESQTTRMSDADITAD